MKVINDALMNKLLYMARIELSSEARAEMEQELDKMTVWLQQLSEVNVDGLSPLTTMSTESNRLRDDVPQPPLPASSVLYNAPDRSSHYFRTPTVKKK